MAKSAKSKKLKPQIIFLVGPTAIGKSALAVKLAKKLKCEIVSCDSMQIYKGMDILSSKPDISMQKKVLHHLLSVVSPSLEFNVAAYRKLALKVIKNIHRKGKIPLFAGGSGLYVNIVVDGIFKGAPKNDKVRDKLYKEACKHGSIFLYDRLKEIDRETAERIHPNDLKRIIRALEVYELTGKPMSAIKEKRSGLCDIYDIKMFALNKNRQGLYEDIDKRVDFMFKKGLVKEVEGLLKKRLSSTCRQAIGIKEVKGYLDGQYTLSQAKELLKKNTRHYAKRQLTWFRKDKRIVWVDTDKRRALSEILTKLRKA